MNEVLFQKNIEKWSLTDPKKALMLPYLDLKNEKNQQKRTSKAVLEKWLDASEIDETEVLFVYGLGQGEGYLALTSWLQGDRRLIFLEDDAEVIFHLLSNETGSLIMNDPKVSLYYFDRIDDIKEITLGLRFEFFMKKIKVINSPHYKKIKNDTYLKLLHRIENDQLLHNSLVGEYLDYGAVFFKNYYKNLELLPGSFLGNSLFGKFKNVPAIICGAGPSLNKHFKDLKALSDHALIFAGGSSLNSLVANGITPHFGAGIDPNAAQILRISQTCHVKIPFFFRNRIHPDALSLIEGARLYVPGSGGYDVSEWFEDKLNIDRESLLDEGHNVINFEVEIAKALGCHPIIFVGMDLGFTGMRCYADGIIDDPNVSKNEILKFENENPKDFDLKAVLKKDIYGKPIYTLWKWIVESEWMGDFAKEHPEIQLINATEGGLGFPNIKNQSLKSVKKQYLQKKYRFASKISKLIKEGSMPQVTLKKIKALKKTLLSSLDNSISCLNILLEELVTMKEKAKVLKKIEPKTNLLTGRAALFESDLFEEDSYKYILEVFGEVFSGLVSHEVRNIRLSKLSDKVKALKKLELNEERIKFLLKVAEVNRMALKLP